MKRYIFWQNIPSHLQSSFLSALSKHGNTEVVLVTENGISQHRKNMGWSMPDLDGVEKIIAAPKKDWSPLLEKYTGEENVHVLSGFGSCELVKFAGSWLAKNNSHFGVMAEIPNAYSSVLPGMRKRLISFRDTARRLLRRKKVDFVLALGQIGMDWYCHAGYPGNRVYPFAYFLDSNVDKQKRSIENSDVSLFRISFVGQLIKRKGVDTLLKSLVHLTDCKWELDVVGDGPERKNLENLAAQLKIDANMHWHGSIANKAVREVLQQSHLFVLPSLDDGWGAVVNEALIAGVPVVVTRSSGSSVVVQSSSYGEIVNEGNELELYKAIEHIWKTYDFNNDMFRLEIQEWSKCIQGESGASYFLSIMADVYEDRGRPAAPWVIKSTQ